MGQQSGMHVSTVCSIHCTMYNVELVYSGLCATMKEDFDFYQPSESEAAVRIAILLALCPC